MMVIKFHDRVLYRVSNIHTNDTNTNKDNNKDDDNTNENNENKMNNDNIYDYNYEIIITLTPIGRLPAM